MNRISRVNSWSDEAAKAAFYQCCASTVWAQGLVEKRPFHSEEELLNTAEALWAKCALPDFLEAFSHHPRIGGNIQSLREKYKSTAAWASQEQKGVQGASEEVLEALSSGNTEYEKKFGFVFLICATGRSASEMLDALQKRIVNSKTQEIENAKNEQAKITQIRLKKMLEEIK